MGLAAANARDDMMKVVPLPGNDKAEMLMVLDSLREAIEAGSIIAFAAVGIASDDNTSLWVAAEPRVSVLRIVGAVAHMNKHIEEEI